MASIQNAMSRAGALLLMLAAAQADAQSADTAATGSVLERVVGAASGGAVFGGGSLESVNGVLFNIADTLGEVDGRVETDFIATGRVINRLDLSGDVASVSAGGATPGPGGLTAVSRRIEPIAGALGDTSTTALSSVNTGGIVAGANQTSAAAGAGAAGAATGALTQLGGAADAQAVLANLATSVASVSGGIEIAAEEVNLNAGDPFSFTSLGSVNTGTIVSGVNASLSKTVESVTALP